jgi:hypothetical protein
LTVAKNNPDDTCPDRKAGSGKKSKVSPATMMAMKAILMNKPTITASLIMNKLFFLQFSCHFAVFFCGPLSFICTNCKYIELLPHKHPSPPKKKELGVKNQSSTKNQ